MVRTDRETGEDEVGMATSPLPLTGIRIADLSRVWAGPYATRLFSDMGAEVIRVENPNLQAGQPYYRNTWFDEYNVGKASITLDLQRPAGVAVFKQLVAVSDIVIENYSARVMGQLGLDYAVLREMRPDIIMISMPGFGLSGPYRDYLAYGTVLEAMSGLSQLTGYPDGPPLRVGVAYADPVAGLIAAFALLAALHHRQQTGQGQFVELSQHETMLGLIPDALMDYMMNGRVRRRQANWDDVAAPQGCYRCKAEPADSRNGGSGGDAWLSLSVTTDEEWRALCRAIGREDLATDPRFRDALRRHSNQSLLDPIIESWTSRFDHGEAMQRLQAVGVPAGAVLTNKELTEDRHLRARGFYASITHHLSGTRLYPGVSARLSRTPGYIRGPSPLPGEHNEQVLTDILGLSTAKLAELVTAGLVLDPNVARQAVAQTGQGEEKTQ